MQFKPASERWSAPVRLSDLLARTCWALSLVLAISSFAAAQTQSGTISGTVTDSTGAVVTDATVHLRNVAQNTATQVTTSDSGSYVVANVIPGEYEITAEKEGFKKSVRRVQVPVGQRLGVDFQLEVGSASEAVTVEAAADAVRTESGEVSTRITSENLMNLPLITRNPYNLVALAGGASDTGRVTGDVRGGRNPGVAVAGARTSSINFMLDGAENNETFIAGTGLTVPLDAVQEFRVQSNSQTAEFGRNVIVTNVVTKAGTNEFHGSLYEYYRGAALTTETYDDKAQTPKTPKSNFVRNQFGGSIGGPILRDKTFFFGAYEGIRVRSAANVRFFVPTQDFLNAASPDTEAYVTGFGGLPQSNCSDEALTADDILGIEGSVDPLTNARTGAPIAGGTTLFCRTTLQQPTDAGGGFPQNTSLYNARVDHHLSASTRAFVRYGYEDQELLPGSVSFSPYAGFTTGQITRNHNGNITLTQVFTPRLFSETRLVYNRFDTTQPLGAAPSTTPCWNYAFNFATPTGDQIVFPGYVPNVCVFAGIPSGGPQNIYQVGNGLTYSRGRHTWKFGGQYTHMRDNHVFGAFQNGFFNTNNMQGMLDGQVNTIQLAVDPKGKFPGDTYDTAVDGPFQPPLFGRHYRYNEVAFYAEDSFKLTPRLTVNAGLRWEYFGVLHSPAEERFLDANLFLDAVGQVAAGKSFFEQIRDARFSRTNNLYQQDWDNFGPRIGLAWDVFGTSRTVFRAGYSFNYDRNFGNALFNVIQNFPNYAVVVIAPAALPIRPNQFDTLAAGGASRRLTGSARMLDREMDTAYVQQWNATLEHDLTGRGVIVSASYLGAKGDKLYSLNDLNMLGSCVKADVNAVCDPSLASGGPASRLNQTGLTGMNRRGNEGFSRYHGLTLEARAARLGATGLNIRGNYTWAHSMDNSSSFFADALLEGLFGFGFRDPYNPALDYADSSNDIRHRGTIAATWELPWFRGDSGLAAQLLGGWTFNTIFAAQTGGAFTVYDGSQNSTCASAVTNFCYPVLTGAVPERGEVLDPSAANSFTLYDLTGVMQTQDQFCGNEAGNNVGCTASLQFLNPQLLSPRNQFRTPGFWNADFSVLKDIRLPIEDVKLQLRAETFNVFNHSNMYVSAGTNLFTGGTSTVVGKKGISPAGPAGGVPNERRNIQLAVRLLW